MSHALPLPNCKTPLLTSSGANRENKSQSQRLDTDALDGLRGAAALHLGLNWPLRDAFGLQTDDLVPMIIFYILSGYVLTITYLKDQEPIPLGRFFTRRLARLYPTYLLVNCFAVVRMLVSPAYWNWKASLTYTHIILVLCCATSIVRWPWRGFIYGVWSGPSWTVSAFALFYICFPSIGSVLRRAHPSYMVVIALFASVLYGTLGLMNKIPRYYDTAWWLLLPFVVGCAAGRTALSNSARLQAYNPRLANAGDAIAAAIFCVIMLNIILMNMGQSNRGVGIIFYTCSFPIYFLVQHLTFAQPTLSEESCPPNETKSICGMCWDWFRGCWLARSPTAFLRSRAMRFMGSISMTYYLIHIELYILTAQFLDRHHILGVHRQLIWLSSIAFSLVVAWALVPWFEKPCGAAIEKCLLGQPTK